MKYIPRTISITFEASVYVTGDYCNVHSNGGSGSVVYESQHNPQDYMLGLEQNTAGWGLFEWGTQGAWGTGYSPMSLTVIVTVPGSWTFAIVAYDKYDNQDSGIPDEETIYACLTPVQPSELSQASYDKDTDILTLNI